MSQRLLVVAGIATNLGAVLSYVWVSQTSWDLPGKEAVIVAFVGINLLLFYSVPSLSVPELVQVGTLLAIGSECIGRLLTYIYPGFRGHIAENLLQEVLFTAVALLVQALGYFGGGVAVVTLKRFIHSSDGKSLVVAITEPWCRLVMFLPGLTIILGAASLYRDRLKGGAISYGTFYVVLPVWWTAGAVMTPILCVLDGLVILRLLVDRRSGAGTFLLLWALIAMYLGAVASVIFWKLW